MKRIFKHFAVNTASLYLVSFFISGIIFERGIETILLAGLALGFTVLIIRPIINILLLPINLVTFGIFKWVGYTLTLYLVTLIVPGFKLADFYFKGFSSSLLTVPSISFSGLFAFIAFSFLISLTSSVLNWIFK